MLIPGLVLTLLGLYAVVFSNRVSERARRDKWAFGGNRLFTVIAGLLILLFGALMLQSSIEQITNSDRESRAVTGWTWFWIISGIGLFALGISQVVFSESWSRRMKETKAKAGAPFFYPTSRRGIIIVGVVQAAWGAWWILGSLPF